jgi:hypothetical protein
MKESINSVSLNLLQEKMSDVINIIDLDLEDDESVQVAIDAVVGGLGDLEARYKQLASKYNNFVLTVSIYVYFIFYGNMCREHPVSLHR